MIEALVMSCPLDNAGLLANRCQGFANRGQRLGGGLDIARWAAVLRDVAGQRRRTRKAGPTPRGQSRTKVLVQAIGPARQQARYYFTDGWTPLRRQRL